MMKASSLFLRQVVNSSERAMYDMYKTHLKTLAEIKETILVTSQKPNKFSVTFGYVDPIVLESLKKEGFDVTLWSERNEDMTKISWEEHINKSAVEQHCIGIPLPAPIANGSIKNKT